MPNSFAEPSPFSRAEPHPLVLYVRAWAADYLSEPIGGELRPQQLAQLRRQVALGAADSLRATILEDFCELVWRLARWELPAHARSDPFHAPQSLVTTAEFEVKASWYSRWSQAMGAGPRERVRMLYGEFEGWFLQPLKHLPTADVVIRMALLRLRYPLAFDPPLPTPPATVG